MKLPFTIMGRSYDVAATLPVEVDVSEGESVDAVLETVSALLPPGQALAESCLVVLSGKHLGTVARHDNVAVSEHDELVLISPVAGG